MKVVSSPSVEPRTRVDALFDFRQLTRVGADIRDSIVANDERGAFL